MGSRLSEICKELKVCDLEQFIPEVELNEPKQFLTDIMELALKERRNRRIARLIKRAGFPAAKTLEGYDFSPITFPEGFQRSDLLSLNFIDRKENVLMIGAVGTGKTHLSIALGVKACMTGYEVKFYRTADLVNELVEKQRLGTIDKFMKAIMKCNVLVIDEVGYVPISKQGSELLFSVISKCYENLSIIITSNLEFGSWNSIFGEARLTTALVDRLIHHCHILNFQGKSYRFQQAIKRKNAMKEGSE